MVVSILGHSSGLTTAKLWRINASQPVVAFHCAASVKHLYCLLWAVCLDFSMVHQECSVVGIAQTPVHCSNDRFSNFQGKKREKSVTFGVAVTHWEGRSDFWPQESSSQCKSQHVYAAPNVLFRRLNTLITWGSSLSVDPVVSSPLRYFSRCPAVWMESRFQWETAQCACKASKARVEFSLGKGRHAKIVSNDFQLYNRREER